MASCMSEMMMHLVGGYVVVSGGARKKEVIFDCCVVRMYTPTPSELESGDLFFLDGFYYTYDIPLAEIFGYIAF